MENKKKVAVLIINYNNTEDTMECLESIVSSSVIPDVYVLDNGSILNDGEKVKEVFPEINWVRSDVNLGFAAGNNKLMKMAIDARYDYLLLLNNDTIIDPLMIERLLSESKDTEVTVPLIYYYYNKKKIWYCGGFINKFTGIGKHYCQNKFKVKKMQKIDFATGCCMMIPVNVIERVGFFNEDYFMYNEDTEYSIRLSEEKINISLVIDAKLWHKVAASSKAIKSYAYIYYSNRNRLKMIRENENFFRKSAYYYSIITRVIKMLTFFLINKEASLLYLKSYVDYRNGVIGRVEI